MRRWLLLVMVLLLPLRGWMGVAMAGEMLQQHLAVPAQVAAMPAEAAHDCDGHHAAGEAAAEEAQAGTQPESDCPTCAYCQACSSVVLLPPAVRAALPPLPNPVPTLSQAGYTSPAPLLAFKPPRA